MTELRIPMVLRAVLLACAISVVASAQTPAAEPALSDDAKLERVKGLYRAGKYQECAAAFDQLLDSKPAGLSDRDVIESARTRRCTRCSMRTA